MTDEERQRLCAKLRREYCDGDYVADEFERLATELDNVWIILRQCQNDVLVAERERDEVLCRVKGAMQ